MQPETNNDKCHDSNDCKASYASIFIDHNITATEEKENKEELNITGVCLHLAMQYFDWLIIFRIYISQFDYVFTTDCVSRPQIRSIL